MEKIKKDTNKVKVTCPDCKGKGEVTKTVSMGGGYTRSFELSCSMCNGKKFIYANKLK